MPSLINKTILILSPQAWGTMFLSKHHYAIELAKRGNRVFFLNPPEQAGKKIGISVNPSGVHSDLFLIEHSLPFSYKIKFHAMPVFHWLMRFHIKRIIKKIPAAIDIVWSFEMGNLYPFRFFPESTYKIFHPVDEPLNRAAIESAKDAQIIFSVTREILDKYKSYALPSHFINHGLSENFLTCNAPVFGMQGEIKIGFSGNLIRNDIDREILLKIIIENPSKIFNFWGAYNFWQSNIGGAADLDTLAFVELLKSQKNVQLFGAVPSEKLAGAMQNMDAFLICYDVTKDQSKGTNYHKVMEFISTGKVTVSNNITTYGNQPNLVQMVSERTHNKLLPELFKQVTDNLDIYNSRPLQEQRQNFAKDNTYSKQVERIEELIYEA